MALELTYQNHFQWGYGDQLYPWRRHCDDLWKVKYGQSDLTGIKDWKSECHRAAKIIHSLSKGQTIWLCLSGGIDSEVMVRAFYEAKIPFKLASLRLAQNLNQHDLIWAEKIAAELDLKINYFDVDIIQFFESGKAIDLAIQTQCVNAEMLGTMHLLDQLDGYPVLGSGECLLAREELPGYVPGISPYTSEVPWYLMEKESVAAWYKYFLYRNREGVAGFFQFTPELITSFLQDPFVRKLTSNQIVGKLTSESSKHLIYNQYWQLEPRKKYNGYEAIRGYAFDMWAYLQNLISGVGEIHKTPVQSLIRNGDR